MGLRILTTVPGSSGSFWAENTVLASGRCVELIYGKKGFFASHLLGLGIAARMLLSMRHFDAVVVEGGRAGTWFALLTSLVPAGGKPVIMIDCLWERHPNRVLRALKRWLTRLSARRIAAFVVWSRHEVEDFAAEFAIPAARFIFIPFHTTLEGYRCDLRDDGFVFAGGNSDRDYRVLIEAVRGSGIPTFIAATDEALFRGIDLPPNVTVKGVSPAEFRDKLAACRLAVVPMRPGTLRSGGQQTFLNAMALGKPTVVVGERVARGYIEDGISGIVVPFGDADTLREAISALYADEHLRHRIGSAGKDAASPLTTERCIRAVHALALRLCVPSGKDLPGGEPAFDAGDS